MKDFDATLWVSLYSRNYSRSSTIINAPSSNVNFLQVSFKVKALILLVWHIVSNEYRVIVVASPSHILVPILRFLPGVKVILDAGWPLSDSNLTREISVHAWVQGLKNLLVDFIAFKLAHFIIFETKQQLFDCCNKLLSIK